VKRRRKAAGRKILTVFILTIFIVTVIPIHVCADTKSILNQFPLQSNDIWTNTIRSIGWSVILGLHWLVGGLESCIYDINDAIGGFFTGDTVTALNQKVLPLALALLVLVLLFVGVQSMIKPAKFTSIAGNFIVGVITMVSLPYLLSAAYTLTTQAVDYLNSDSEGHARILSDRILTDNITDTTRYDAEGFKSTTLQYKNAFQMEGANAGDITKIDINELVNPDDMQYPDVWKHRIVIDANGNETLQELNSGQIAFVNLPMFSNYYYRWNVDWLTILCTLLVSAFALLLSGIKIARLIYELAIHQTMTQVIALLDIVTAQRLKKCIRMLISTLGTLFAVFFMLQLYILGMAYISDNQNINFVVRIILMIALAFAVIDGPSLFEQIFGIDAGIHSAVRTLYGLKAAGSMAAGAVAMAGGKAALDSLRAKGMVGAARSALGKASGIVGRFGGAAAGVAAGAMQNHRRTAAVKQNFAAAGAGAAGAAQAVKETFDAPNKTSDTRTNGEVASGGAERAAGNSVRTDDVKTRPVSVNETAGTNQVQNHSIHSAAQTGTQDTTNLHSPPTEPSNSDAANTSNISAETSGNATQAKPASVSEKSATLGGYLHSQASNRIRQSNAYTKARHAYSLTLGSMQRHGDKKVSLGEQAVEKKLQNPDLSYRQAVRQAKQENITAKAQSLLTKGEMKQ
jgi:hypothetical protein